MTPEEIGYVSPLINGNWKATCTMADHQCVWTAEYGKRESGERALSQHAAQVHPVRIPVYREVPE